jgi:hypothetical protein
MHEIIDGFDYMEKFGHGFSSVGPLEKNNIGI